MTRKVISNVPLISISADGFTYLTSFIGALYGVLKGLGKIQKDPLARAKGLAILGKTKITHIFDRESEEDVHVRQFQTNLDRMKMGQNIGKHHISSRI